MTWRTKSSYCVGTGRVDTSRPTIAAHPEATTCFGAASCLSPDDSPRLPRMAEIPTGAVTFLFTDIEGSTRLVKQLRERYARGTRRSSSSFVRHSRPIGGTRSTRRATPSSSLSRAHAMPSRGGGRSAGARSHDWPDGVEIKVRMGLHTGQAIAEPRPLHRARGAPRRTDRRGGPRRADPRLQATQTLLEDEEEDLHVHLARPR